MDYKEFAIGREPVIYPERDGSQREVLEDADAWSRFFESAILQRLEHPDDEPLMSFEDINKILNDFEDWTNGPLEGLLSSLEHYSTERSQTLLNYTNFHVMSSMFTQQWFRLLAGTSWDARDAHQFNTETQDYLALLSVKIQKQREQASLARSATDFAGRARAGILGEYDVAIVELEALKTHPELLLLPAPGRFEHEKSSGKNADFLILDMANHEITGAQVKTSVGKRVVKHYDPNFVFLVDTQIDLDDVVAITEPGSTTPKIVSHPGLVAAHLVRNWPKQMNLQSHPWLNSYVADERQFLGLKFYANMLTRNTKDASELARKRLAERTLHYLYRKPIAQDVSEVAS